jgi:hypothetical protein
VSLKGWRASYSGGPYTGSIAQEELQGVREFMLRLLKWGKPWPSTARGACKNHIVKKPNHLARRSVLVTFFRTDDFSNLSHGWQAKTHGWDQNLRLRVSGKFDIMVGGLVNQSGTDRLLA